MVAKEQASGLQAGTVPFCALVGSMLASASELTSLMAGQLSGSCLTSVPRLRQKVSRALKLCTSLLQTDSARVLHSNIGKDHMCHNTCWAWLLLITACLRWGWLSFR